MIRFLGRSPALRRNSLFVESVRGVVTSHCPDSNTDAVKEEAKPFFSVPGPKKLPVIGNLHLFSRFGPYTFERLYDAYADLYEKHGPIVRLDVGIKMLLLFRPEDIKKLFVNEKHPQRPLFEALKHYRLKRKDVYSCAGMITENGEEWWRIRKPIQFIMNPAFPKIYFPHHAQIADDLVRFIDQKRDAQGIVPDFLKVLYRFTEEAVGLLCFGKRLGLLSLNSGTDAEADFSKQLTQASEDTLKSLADSLLEFPWWKIFPTSTYKTLVRTQDFFQSFAAKCIKEAELKLKDPAYKDDGSLELLRRLFEDETVKPTDISLLMTELFAAGIDTTGNTIGFALYNLAKNPDVQEKLYRHIQKGVSDVLTADSLYEVRYLRACILESHRVSPATGSIARILTEPKILSGYQIPENVLCIGMQPIICRQEQHFDDPMDFRPERWLNEDHSKMEKKYHPYTLTPFSTGRRKCVGFRIAEQEINICVLKIIQNFRVEYDGPEIGAIMRLSFIPDKPLNLKFIPRK
ncbi:Cytochrome P450 302a1, mitochondrial [Araneus ventricosus]|uniref:Cytochrome P450 302a1, mitochondrial n=1 Tax=Araneus ventricosus TaxID=182803 RepID=A0A4Y2DZM7_ARAVE|nr:Cytochrome P450 302a1, mitochondrial [Araneus ventricosus]